MTMFKNDGVFIREKVWLENFDRHWGQPIFYSEGLGSFPGVRRPGRDVDHPHPSSAEFKNE